MTAKFAKCVEVLPATRSESHRGYSWEPCPADAACPCSGVLTVTTKRKHQRYAITELVPDRGWDGRAFEVRKPDGTVYHCFLAANRQDSTCDCPAKTYAAAERADRRHGDRYETLGCCHLDAIDSIVGNGWLPHPGAGDPAADVGTAEIDVDEIAAAYRAVYDEEVRLIEERYGAMTRPLPEVPF